MLQLTLKTFEGGTQCSTFKDYYLGQVSFRGRPGRGALIFRKLKTEDEDWTSADTCENEGDFAPDKQVSPYYCTITDVSQRQLLDLYSINCKYSPKGCITVTDDMGAAYYLPDIYIL